MQAAWALVLVAQTLSFTEAAAIMGTSVAVGSRSIAALERSSECACCSAVRAKLR